MKGSEKHGERTVKGHYLHGRADLAGDAAIATRVRQRHGRQRTQPKRWHVGRLDRLIISLVRGDRGNQRRIGREHRADSTVETQREAEKGCAHSPAPLYQHASLKTTGGKVDCQGCFKRGVAHSPVELAEVPPRDLGHQVVQRRLEAGGLSPPHQRDGQPCLLYRHAISLVALGGRGSRLSGSRCSGCRAARFC